MRPAGGIPQREVAEQEPRHAAEFHQVLGAAHDHGRDSIRLKMPCDQTHGLMTDGSIGDQNRGVGSGGADISEDFGRVLLDGDFLAAVGRRADELGRQ